MVASKESKSPRLDVIEKVKEFLRMTEEPKWYFLVEV